MGRSKLTSKIQMIKCLNLTIQVGLKYMLMYYRRFSSSQSSYIRCQKSKFPLITILLPAEPQRAASIPVIFQVYIYLVFVKMGGNNIPGIFEVYSQKDRRTVPRVYLEYTWNSPLTGIVQVYSRCNP